MRKSQSLIFCYVIQCEKKLRMNGDGNILRKNEAEDDSHDQDDEEEETFINRASKLCKQVGNLKQKFGQLHSHF